MSLAEIIEALPKLSEAEQRDLLRKLQELAEEQEEVKLCDHIATEGAVILDQLEESDARLQEG